MLDRRHEGFVIREVSEGVRERAFPCAEDGSEERDHSVPTAPLSGIERLRAPFLIRKGSDLGDQPLMCLLTVPTNFL